MKKKVLIIGAGPAGLAAAEAAAAQGAAVTLCGAEPYPPYWRPRLTHYLAEPVAAEKLAIRKPEWYAANGIELRIGLEAERIDTAKKTVIWKNGGETPWDTLVLATGAKPNTPALPGVTDALTLRGYDDAVRVREAAMAAGRAVIVGGGLLGLETAWELNAAGVKTTVVERSHWLMPRQLNREAGLYLQRRLESSGLSLVVGQDPSTQCHLYGGACVLLCAGVQANLSILEGTGIATEQYVVVDNRMQTNISGIFACGDVAAFNGRSWGLIAVAQEQGKAAGTNAAGGQAVYAETPPSPMLKVGSLGVFSVGDVAEGEGIVSMSEENEHGYVCLMLRDRVLAGAVLVGSTAMGAKLKKAVGDRQRFTGIKSITELMNLL